MPRETPLPPTHDGRSPEELLENNDNRWPVGTFKGDPRDLRRLYVPPHLGGASKEKERLRFIRKMLLLEVEKVPFAPAVGDEPRAGGDCICYCGFCYYDHPCDPMNPHLTILCDRTRVKT